LVYREKVPRLRKCKSCGLAWVDPAPSAAELAEIYSARYFQTFGYDASADKRYRHVRAATSDRVLAIAERCLAVGGLLDVGSGLGDLLAAAIRRGWDARGIEPNPWARAEADRVAPDATRTCAIEEFEPGKVRFDLVTCIDVIEHLRRPDEALRRFFGWLRPGGSLALTTPDIGSLLARLMGAHWPHFHVDHLWYFNRETLTAMVERAGFEVLDWRRAPKVFNLAYIAGIFERHSTSAPVRRIAEGMLRRCPPRLLGAPWPAIREGQLLIARRPSC